MSSKENKNPKSRSKRKPYHNVIETAIPPPPQAIVPDGFLNGVLDTNPQAHTESNFDLSLQNQLNQILDEGVSPTGESSAADSSNILLNPHSVIQAQQSEDGNFIILETANGPYKVPVLVATVPPISGLNPSNEEKQAAALEAYQTRALRELQHKQAGRLSTDNYSSDLHYKQIPPHSSKNVAQTRVENMKGNAGVPPMTEILPASTIQIHSTPSPSSSTVKATIGSTFLTSAAPILRPSAVPITTLTANKAPLRRVDTNITPDSSKPSTSGGLRQRSSSCVVPTTFRSTINSESTMTNSTFKAKKHLPSSTITSLASTHGKPSLNSTTAKELRHESISNRPAVDVLLSSLDNQANSDFVRQQQSDSSNSEPTLTDDSRVRDDRVPDDSGGPNNTRVDDVGVTDVEEDNDAQNGNDGNLMNNRGVQGNIRQDVINEINPQAPYHQHSCCAVCSQRLENLGNHVQIIGRQVAEILQHARRDGRENVMENNEDNILPVLPFNDSVTFMAFNENLQNDRELRRQFVALITKLGGKDYKQAVSNAMEQIMTDELCAHFSWTGVRETQRAADLEIITIIRDIIVRSTNSTIAVIESRIAEWLRRFGDRIRATQRGGAIRRRRARRLPPAGDV